MKNEKGRKRNGVRREVKCNSKRERTEERKAGKKECEKAC